MIRALLVVAVFAGVSLAGVAQEQPDEADNEMSGTLRVGTREAVPFAMLKDGEWIGISIDLWRELAEEMMLEYEFVESDLDELISGVENGTLDLSISALTTTAEREERVDFSQPYYDSGLGIAVKKGPGGWLRMARQLMSVEFLRTLLLLLTALFLVGALIWWFERRRNDQFGGDTREGLWSGFWWSAVTMTTVGYGDKAPITVGGRVVALIWMFVGLVAISSLTAAMTSALTLSQMGSSITGPGDLNDVKIGSVASSTSENYLHRHGLSFESYDTVNTALAALDAGDVEAVVYDMPILVYLCRTGYDELTTVGSAFDRQSYGIAFPEGSPMRELVNRKLLDLIRDEEWRSIRTRYLGESRSH